MPGLRHAALVFAALCSTAAPAQPGFTFAQVNAEAAARTGTERNLSTHLLRAREAARRGLAHPRHVTRDSGGRFQVAIRTDFAGADLSEGLRAAGAAITFQEMGSGYIEAWVSPERLHAVASVPGVNFLRPILPAVPRTGAVLSEGDAFHQANAARFYLDIAGGGVKVGLITTGVRGLAGAQAFGDLPLVLDNQIPPGVPANTDGDGTALLEIMRDVAPDIRMAYAVAITPGNYLQCLTNLRNAGCDIIVDHLGFYAEPFFEDGMLAQALDQAAADGFHVVSAAGNDGQNHWEGPYVDVDPLTGVGVSDDFHAFAPNDPYLAITIRPQTVCTVVLQWSDPFGASATDYNLYLYDGPVQNLLDSSLDIQDGNDDPFEFVQFYNTTNADQLGQIAIDKVDPLQPDRRLEFFVIGSPLSGEVSIGSVTIDEPAVPAGSIIGQAAARSAITVAALDVTAPPMNVIEPFSSRGPSVIEHASAETRLKPNVSAADRVSITTGSGEPIPFLGTSAAAAHTVGIMALLLELNPALDPQEMKDTLEASCYDILLPGYDTTSGAGRLDALLAILSVPLSGAEDWTMYR